VIKFEITIQENERGQVRFSAATPSSRATSREMEVARQFQAVFQAAITGLRSKGFRTTVDKPWSDSNKSRPAMSMQLSVVGYFEKNIMNNLEQIQRRVESNATFTPPTGTRREQGLELLRRCKERDIRLEEQALEAEREGDQDGCWLAMAARAESKRAMDKIQSDLSNEPK
jgi:hypothetical protein